MFDNITRGGQLFLHAIRMFRQVVRFLINCSLLVALIVFCVKSYSSIKKEEMDAYIDYQCANFMNSMYMDQKTLNVKFYDQKTEIRPGAVLGSPYFYNKKKIVENKIIVAAYFTGKVVIGVFILLSIFCIRRGLSKSGEKFNRGAELGEFKEIRKKIEKDNKSKNYKAYGIAGMPYPTMSETEHTLIIGSTGTGKTVLISDLVEQIRARGEKAIIYDKKGDYIRWFYDAGKDFILNPFDERGSKWNLLGEIEHVGHLKSIAQSFISDKGGYGGESRIWDEAARIAFSGILEKLMSNKEDLTNQEIVDLILCQDIEEVAKLVKNTYAQSTIDPNSPKTAASVMFVLATHFSSLRLTTGTKEESFSIKKWLKDEKKDSILFISSSSDLSAELAPLVTAWFEIAINGILSQPQTQAHKTWVILDELPTIQKIPSLSQGLSVARSYGGCFVLGAQNIAQMREIYGKNLSEDISSECNTRVFFKTNDPDTAKWICQNIGESEITEYKEGLSYGAHSMRDGTSVNVQEKLKSLILPSEIQSMSKLNLLLKMPGYSAVRTKLTYKDRVILNSSFVPSAKEEIEEEYKDESEININSIDLVEYASQEEQCLANDKNLEHTDLREKRVKKKTKMVIEEHTL